MKTVIIVPDPHDKSTWSTADVDDVCAYLDQQFKIFPENTRIYHNAVAHKNDVTPKTQKDIEYLQSLDGVFYVVIYPALDPISWAFIAVTAIMAAFSVYTILTMPKPDSGAIGSANNELANRSNQARIKSRIPDIYGQVRSYPDLIAVTYNYYLDGIEIEECLMAIGRGYYQIHDCRDGDTDANGIDGVSVSIYDPDTDITGNNTIYRVGQAFNELPLAIRKSDSINGQSLKAPNDVKIESNSIYFTSGGVIRRTDSSIDFTDNFAVGDKISISGAQFGVADIEISGNCIVSVDSNMKYYVTVQTNTDIHDYADYKGLLLNGATFELIIETSVTNEDETVTTTTESTFRDLSGQYDVAGITRSSVDSGFEYVIELSSPKQVNYNWNYVTEDHTITAGIILNENTGGMILDDNYSVSAIDEHSIALENATTVNSDWLKVDTLFNGSTQGQAPDVYLELVASKWVGWFDIFFDDADQAVFNIYFPQGLYNINKDGKTRPGFAVITVEYQAIDDNGNPLESVKTYSYREERTSRESFGITLRIDLAIKDNIRFRIAKTDAKTGANPMTECKIKDVYLAYAYDKSTYPDVTVVRSRTVATDGALSLKERKLNCLVTRKLNVDGTGGLVATKDAGQALINMALDEFIGRRSLAEIDIDQIKSEINAVKNYFGSSVAAEFSYTFDDDNLSFEEQAGMVASACFCEDFRFGNKLRLRLEKPQENSVLLFNHRNKVPGSDKRTLKFSIDKDYDGVELEYTSPDDDVRITYSVPEDIVLTNPLKINTSGIRNHAVAKTRAWREWNKLLYQDLNVEFDALDESELLTRNDRILVADNTILGTQDGEIVAVDVLTLTCSQIVRIEEDQQYYCYLQMPDGTVDIIECIAGEMENEIILSRAPLHPLVVDPDRYVKTLYSITKIQDSGKQAFMLSEMTPNDQMTNKLTCINYSDRYYEKDHSFI